MNRGEMVSSRLLGGNLWICFFLVACYAIGGSEARGLPDVISSKNEALQIRADEKPRTKEELSEHLRSYRENPKDQALLLEIGRDYLELANEGEFHYLDQAVHFFRKVLAQNPKNPVILMFLGRAIGAKALDQDQATMTRLRWAREGFRYMDQSIDLDDNSLYLRLLRAEAQLLAHPILRRGSRLLKDHAFIQKFMKSTAFNEIPDFQKARVHLYMGNYQERKKKNSEASDHWAEVIKLADNTPISDEARQRLEGSYRDLGYQD